MLLLYLCLAPCGRRFSIDALLARRAHRRPRFRRRLPTTCRRPRPIATRLIQVHLVLLIAMMGFSKLAGEAWWNGTGMWWLIARPESRLVDFTWLYKSPKLIDALDAPGRAVRNRISAADLDSAGPTAAAGARRGRLDVAGPGNRRLHVRRDPVHRPAWHSSRRQCSIVVAKSSRDRRLGPKTLLGKPAVAPEALCHFSDHWPTTGPLTTGMLHWPCGRGTMARAVGLARIANFTLRTPSWHVSAIVEIS